MNPNWDAITLELIILAVTCFAVLKVNEYAKSPFLSRRWAIAILILGIFLALQSMVALYFAT